MDLRTPTTTVFVADLDTAVEFYALLLGAEPDERPKGVSAYWRLPDGTTLLVAADRERAGGAAFTVGTDDLEGTVERLMVAGYPAGDVVTGALGRFCEVRDADGNAVTLQQIALSTPGTASVSDMAQDVPEDGRVTHTAPTFTMPQLRDHRADAHDVAEPATATELPDDGRSHGSSRAERE